MSDESRDEEPILSGEKFERVQRDLRNAIREATEAVHRAAEPLRIGTAIEAVAAEDIAAGVMIVRQADGTVRGGFDPASGDIVTLEQRRELAEAAYNRQLARVRIHSGSVAMPMYGSMAYMAGDFAARMGYARGGQYQFTEKFPKEVTDKAWKLLEQFMTPEQHFAFMEKADIELENVAGDFRLIINRSGKFTILEGARGKGIVAQSGNVRSYKYPLGDEVAAFIDWFNHRTKELIAQWGCGTYGIVEDGERR